MRGRDVCDTRTRAHSQRDRISVAERRRPEFYKGRNMLAKSFSARRLIPEERCRSRGEGGGGNPGNYTRGEMFAREWGMAFFSTRGIRGCNVVALCGREWFLS